MIIAEIGLNHLGESKKLFSMIENLCKTNVDAITLQIRESSFYLMEQWTEYQLDDDIYLQAADKIRSNNKKFGIALSDKSKVHILDNIVDFYKVLSKDIKNINLIEKLGKTGKKIFVSTGNSDYEEIDSIAKQPFDINLIHTRLSNDISDVNLKAITHMKNRYSKDVSFGNHCSVKNVLFAAVSFEPSDYFIYVKDKDYKVNIPPDLHHAININYVNYYIDNIRLLESCLGTGNKSKSINQIKGQQ